MPKTRLRKPIHRDGDRKIKPVADTHNGVAHTAESALPPKKPSTEREAPLAQGEGAEVEVTRERNDAILTKFLRTRARG